MPFKIIGSTAYKNFISTLEETQPAVAAPHWKEGKTTFELLGTDFPELGEEVGPTGYIPTLLSPKKYFFPQDETLFTFTQGQISEKQLSQNQLILVGLRPCDLNAIRQMDRVFLDDIEDPYYKARREKILLIGWDCIEHCDESCFCESVGGLFVNENSYDLLVTPLQGGYNDYVISIGSSKGADLLAQHAQAKDIDDRTMAIYQHQQAEKLLNFPRRLKENIGSVPLLLVGSYESPHWQELGDLCFGCGACIMVCPTCSCFDVRDEMMLDLESGNRHRCWDGCMLQDFALVAGGHNFRLTRKERIRHRIYRKFKYQMQRYNEPYCVGCGRCIRSCLVDINPYEIINRLFELNLERRKSEKKCP